MKPFIKMVHREGEKITGRNRRRNLIISVHLVNDQLDSEFCVKGPIAHRILAREHRFLLLAAKQDGEFSQTAHLHITKARVCLTLGKGKNNLNKKNKKYGSFFLKVPLYTDVEILNFSSQTPVDQSNMINYP